MNVTMPLNQVKVESVAFVQKVNIKGALGARLRDLGFVSGARVEPLFSGGGIRAYALCGTVIALRDADAARVEVTHE